ncbi:hypothetical protein CAXC1_220058 [Candidatus Xenohaliotis californiensis]|uniref:Uncharacterized protein n=2 Tax=Candidatus Xenohaliotis californiensis TaxID=84677 RepID=A0ABP0EW07_9RICK|nr:hypothetical protein CAXC1_220058 [Candidatus Xenohaliotis californiensis]
MKAAFDAQLELYKNYRNELEKYRINEKVFKIKEDKKLNKILNKKTQNCDELNTIPPPMSSAIVTTDPTYEGLFKLFEEGRPSVGLFSNKGGQFIGGHGMNKENRAKTISEFSKFWDGTPLNRTRAGSDCSNIYKKCLSIHILMQPKISELLLSDILTIEQEILLHFLIAYPVSKIGYRNKNFYNVESEECIRNACKKNK